MSTREQIANKKRIVVKVGSSSLQHPETGEIDFVKMDVLARELCNLKNRGKDVILVSSGSIAMGRAAANIKKDEATLAMSQACAAIGQANLIMLYQKMFGQYNNQLVAQVLMTKATILDNVSRVNAQNTFSQLLQLGVIPIVNENDSVSTYEIQFGENDTLSAIVTSLLRADLLILLSDIDGLFTDDPNQNESARFIEEVESIDEKLMKMGKESTGSAVGSGGMNSKLKAAKIATAAGADMIIANGSDMRILHRIMDGRNMGTLFKANQDIDFYLKDYLEVSV